MVQNLLFLLDNPYTNDRRVQREAEALVAHGYSVTIIATIKSELKTVEELNGIKVIRLFDDSIFDVKNVSASKTYVKKILSIGLKIDVIHAHDQTMLNIGVGLKQVLKNVVLIYDSHELFSSWPINLSNYSSFTLYLKSYIVRKVQVMRERRNMKHVDYVITVNDSIANYLKKDFKLDRYPVVIRNIPEKAHSKFENSDILRSHFNIDKSTRILVFIGANIYARTLNLEQVIHQFANDNRFALVFIAAKNINSKPIEKLVSDNNYSNIYFHDIIPPQKIIYYLKSADVGLVPTWNKKDLSYWFALDNKLFEYLNAGIPILATAQPEYKSIVETYNCGLCVNADLDGAYLNGMIKILENYQEYQSNCLNANEELNWENESKKLIALYKTI